MKKSKTTIRPFAKAKWFTISIVGVLVVVFVTATALMQSRDNDGNRGTSPNGIERADAQLEKSLFVDERRPTGSSQSGESEVQGGGTAAAQDGETPAIAIQKVAPAQFRGDVRHLRQVPMTQRPERPEFEEPDNPKFLLPEARVKQAADPNVPLAPMPAPNQNFAGLGRNDACTGGPCGAGTPPDTNGDVGPNHYIQSVNDAFGIYSKTGTLLASFTENSLFSAGPTGTICDTNGGGDPVVVYDSMADRWILTNLAYTGNATVGPFFQCMAVSKTGDPVSGGWYLYAVRTDTGVAGQPAVNVFPDYPKFGVWTDCLYYSANGFNSAGSFVGGVFGSFSRLDMYSGHPLTAALGFSAGGSDFYTMMPANLSAPANGLPPAGRLNYYVQESLTAFNYRVRSFTPGANCGGGGSLSAATLVSQTGYTTPGTDVTQPNTANLLDSLGDRVMQKNQYRNVGGVESLWITHSTRTAPVDQPQWAQINVTGGTIVTTPAQQQIYAPDATMNRWMGSIAADKDGNVALAYSTSNGTSPNFPSIAYSGRLVGDALNQLPQTETQLFAGSGSQTGNCGGAPCHRWGDYSSISVDPSDSCTFWVTTEYLASQADGSNTSPIWSTRIGSFVFPTCVAVASTPTIPAAPSNLTFTGVTQFAMTLNWADNASNEDGYIIYRSTDNVNFSFAALTAANATSQPFSGLNPSTTYFWQVYAFTKGALSSQLAGSQATTPLGSVSCVGAGGNWSSTATWSGAALPAAGDNVTIIGGCTVTIDTAAVAFGVTINSGGILQFETTNAQTLTAGGDVTIDSGGTLQSATTLTQTGHVLSVGGNLTNNGILNFSTNTNTAGAGITFTGASNNTFGGTGATTNVRTLTMNKGTSNANTLDLSPTNFTVQGISAAVPTFVTLTNGTLKFSGTFTFSSVIFSAAGYTIPATAGFWLNNPNFTVTGQAGSPTNNGLLRVSQGTFNVGTGSGNAMGAGAGAAFTVNGGTLNFTGRLNTANAVSYVQSGGTVNCTTVGNASSSAPGFGLTSGSSTFTMSGGAINLVQASTAVTPLDYQVSAAASVTGGTLNVGTAATTTNFSFRIQGNMPNLVIDNTTNNKTAILTATSSVFGNVTLNTATTLNAQTFTIQVFGNATNFGNVVNNGSIINTLDTNANRFQFFSTFGPQTYSGTGNFGTALVPYAGIGISNNSGVTVSSPMTVRRINLFNGPLLGVSNITMGFGGASSTIIQISQAANPVNGGSLDSSPNYNTGTGGHTVLYLQEPSMRTTSFEIPSSRSVLTITEDNTSNVTLAGGNLTLTSATTAATLTNGRFITGSNTLIVSNGAATITRTTGYVDGNLRKTYTAIASKTYEVGTANAYSPVTVNATAGTFPSDFTATAVQGPQPNVSAATSIKRYWTLTEGGTITANLTFNYIDPLDIMGTEANYRLIRVMGGIPVSFINNCPTPPTGSACVDTTANTALINGVTEFSDWTVGESLAPTAAPASISGRITTTNGAPVAGVTMRLSGARSTKVITDASGNYRFDAVDTDNFYTVTPSLVNYHFAPESQSFSLLANKTDAVFTGIRDAVNGGNVIDTPDYFVRQHYLDFLGREPDESGFNFWSDQISSCGADAGCRERRTINVSAAYFLSIEFQQTGGLVDGLYRASYGRAPRYAEFMPDTATVAQGVIVGTNGNWAQTLEANKQAFVDAWMQRAEFRAAYDGLTNNAYIDKLIGNAGAGFNGDRNALVNGLTSGSLTRSAVLRQVVENEGFVHAKSNKMFVMLEYFGYLRRDPDASGYQFWLNKLNQFDGNFERAEMVKAFIVSDEYRARFAQ